MKKILYAIPFILLILSFCSCQQQNTNRLPNIVIIFIDDQGYGDLGRYGAIDYTTPNIDELADEGMMFTNFYAAQAVCSASRAGLMTGCYPNRIGIHGALAPWSRIALNAGEVTIAEMLKQKGYKTGMAGKWHLGDEMPYLPLQNGFDEYLGLPYSNDMWPVDYDGTPITDTSVWKSHYPPLPLIKGNEKIREIRTLDDQDELTTIYTEFATDFIKRNRDDPFFLYLAHSMCHVPLGVSDKFRGKSRQGMFGDVIEELDWSVGEVMKTLKDNGLEDNTFVIYTSDNGPWINFGNHAGSTGGLREGKGTSFEGGQREPCIMRWPGTIPVGKICNNLASTIDILPTLAEITGAGLPDHKIDGVSILPLLRGVKDANPRDHFYYYYQLNALEAVRKGHWKLVLPHPSRSYEGVLPGKDGYPGEYNHIDVPLALYDLRRDPGERYDVKEQNPEIVQELQDLADQARQDLGDDLTNTPPTNNRPAAIVEK